MIGAGKCSSSRYVGQTLLIETNTGHLDSVGFLSLEIVERT